MAHPVPLPHMGVSVEEATVTVWHKAVGDAVREGEPLCDISTDKVETVLTAPVDGVLAAILAPEGETVPVGAVLAELTAPAESGVDVVSEPASPRSPDPLDPVPGSAAPVAPAVVRFDPVRAAEAVLDRTRPNGHGPPSSPVARRLAAERGIDLAAVTGSGRRGRIRKADVLAAVAAPAPAFAPAPASAPGGAAGTPVPGAVSHRVPRGYDDVPHEIVTTSRIRRVTAEHMIRSRQTAAHMTTEVEVDMSAALAARAELNPARLQEGRSKLTPLALITRVACVALHEFADLNATFQHEQLIRWREVNVGIAVDTPQGLLVPVIRGCEQLTTAAIAEAIATRAERARQGQLVPDDLRAGTFTISNPGSVGAHSAMAIINQPQVAILGLPMIVRRPAVVIDPLGQEAIGIRPLMLLALTFDHRAVDGAYATRCLVRMREMLEGWSTGDYA
ncbi:MAG TPA: dihydrolipoamide acetyltransferase family protein [Solirubrobacteraceae bacterium]|nr:dihydrolipoamide acetyltransferase family protein [Solirubrobacteraceae bacterium]